MMTALRLHNFRAFRELSVEGLTRVSLLVGANNSGKTSVLDAAELVLMGTPAALMRSALRRGETSTYVDVNGNSQRQFELNHLFHGHSVRPQTRFSIEADDQRFFSCTAVAADSFTRLVQWMNAQEFPPADLGAVNLLLSIESDKLKSDDSKRARHLPTVDGITPLGAFGTDRLTRSSEPGDKVTFVGTEPPPPARLHALWDRVVLKPEEAQVTDILRIIEPDIERIAALSSGGGTEGRMFVKLKGSEQRIPLGSMGEGIKRLLVLSLNLVSAAGGYLLVDEIDTGLHHSVMVKMWRLVVEAAKRLDVQVLATTHSLDCVQAFAALYEQQPEVRDAISLHRIERGATASVPYTADELLEAARHQMELR